MSWVENSETLPGSVMFEIFESLTTKEMGPWLAP